MNSVLRYAGQALAYAGFAAAAWSLSGALRYAPIQPGGALIKVSFSHQGERLGECRERSAEELAGLPANMRAVLDCPRERSPIDIEIELDGEPLYRATVQPTGFSKDGSAYVYQRFEVPAGTHRVVARLRDAAASARFGYTRDAAVKLAPAQVLVVDFDPALGGFVFKGAAPAAPEEHS